MPSCRLPKALRSLWRDFSPASSAIAFLKRTEALPANFSHGQIDSSVLKGIDKKRKMTKMGLRGSASRRVPKFKGMIATKVGCWFRFDEHYDASFC